MTYAVRPQNVHTYVAFRTSLGTSQGGTESQISSCGPLVSCIGGSDAYMSTSLGNRDLREHNSCTIRECRFRGPLSLQCLAFNFNQVIR